MRLTAALFLTSAAASTASPFPWMDTATTSDLYEAIVGRENTRLELMLAQDPELGQRRSADGRGGAWWAFEHGNVRALALLAAQGLRVPDFDRDATGKFPKDMCVPPQCDLGQLSREVAADIPVAQRRLAEYENEDEEEEVDSHRLNELLNSPAEHVESLIDDEL